LNICIVWPGATGERGRIGEQNTHGESNSAHFSVKAASPAGPPHQPNPPTVHPTAAKGGFLSFFGTIQPPKLMQKIHRLTDN
jgi:hypothetical protein